MVHLRFWIAATLAWLLVFYNIERFHAPINLASFVYVLVAGIGVSLIEATAWLSSFRHKSSADCHRALCDHDHRVIVPSTFSQHSPV